MFNSFGSLSDVIEIALLTWKIVAIILTIRINLLILTFSILIISRTPQTCKKLIAKHILKQIEDHDYWEIKMYVLVIEKCWEGKGWERGKVGEEKEILYVLVIEKFIYNW